MLTHDIDWFFESEGVQYHCASNSGIIPLKCRTITNLNSHYKSALTLPKIYKVDEIQINEDYINGVLDEQEAIIREMHENGQLTQDLEYNRDIAMCNYLSSFAQMAMRGFVSMDRKYSKNDDVLQKVLSTHEDIVRITEEYTVIATPPLNGAKHLINRIDLPVIDVINNEEKKSVSITVDIFNPKYKHNFR